MDLFELEKEKKFLENKILSKKERIELECSKLEAGAIDYSKVMVQSSHSNDSMTDAIAKIVEMEKELDFLEKELEQNERELNRLYDLYKTYKDEHKQIYYERKILGWRTVKVAVKHGKSERQIRRIIGKMREKFNKN